MDKQANIVICGAGIAGVAAAYQLVVQHGLQNVVLVDERPPLTLTSDKSTEAYRNWWPGPDNAMIGLMNRSIDILEALADESDNRFLLNRRGYLHATADASKIANMTQQAKNTSAMGGGPLRIYTGDANDPVYQPATEADYANQPEGADLFLDQTTIQKHFPYLADETVAVLHARRCGWFSGQQLGMYMLEQIRAHGAELIHGRVEEIITENGCVAGVNIAQGERIQTVVTQIFVNAAGPYAKAIGKQLGVDLPIYFEPHLKASYKDHLQIVPRDAPMMIWEDRQCLNWTAEEKEFLAESDETRWLLEEFPASVHGRPEGHGSSQQILCLWDYHVDALDHPEFPIVEEPDYPEVVMRGMSTMIPALTQYIDRYPQVYIDGGYYARTRENRLLCGPLPVAGAFILAALSGFGAHGGLRRGRFAGRPHYGEAIT